MTVCLSDVAAAVACQGCYMMACLACLMPSCVRCSAHHFAYNGSMYAVNERFQRVGGQGSDPQTARWLAVNHYITRSKQVRAA